MLHRRCMLAISQFNNFPGDRGEPVAYRMPMAQEEARSSDQASDVFDSAAGANKLQAGAARGRLASLVWPLVLAMTLMVLLSMASVAVLSYLRAYVNGEGLWSKAERQAIADLHLYAMTGDDADYRRFHEQLRIPLGDRLSRLQLQSLKPDLDAARRGFLDGQNDPADISGMIRLFRVFGSTQIMAEPLRIWASGDELILQLARIGAQLHEQMSSGERNFARIVLLLRAADGVHVRVAPLEDEFSKSLGSVSRQVAGLLLTVLTICGAALVCFCAVIFRMHLQRSARMAAALRASQELVYLEQERAHVTLESIADAVIAADPQRNVTYMNAAAEHLLGCTQALALGRPLTELVTLAQGSQEHSVLHKFQSSLEGRDVIGAKAGVLLQRHGGSTVLLHERIAPMRDRGGDCNGVVLVLRDITNERALAERLEYQATHDSLTGLTNRPEFESRLAAAIAEHRAHGAAYAVLYLDLDQFKVINDTCGHAAGDDLIRQVAWLVKERLRGEDVLARLGGDEFGALLEEVEFDAALALCETIRASIAALRFCWGERVFPITASIGVLKIDQTVADVGDALSAADQACYLAKDSGRNRVQVYRPDDQLVCMRHSEMRWVERLNAALDNDKFVLFAQEIRPIATRHVGRVVAMARFELLLRMLATDGTWIAPMAFIPAAERYGLMPRIDRWVIARACKQLAQLRARGQTLPVCTINLSGASVSDPDLADYVAGCLREHDLAGEQFGFELTETTAVGNLASASLLMARLRALGASIALDDFGSGMSSFSYLKALPIDLLKIDGAFVRDVGANPFDLAVVESIQRIARVMGIETVAECVEHEAALRALMKVGVDYVQGFHIGRPDLLERAVTGTATSALPQRLSNS